MGASFEPAGAGLRSVTLGPGQVLFRQGDCGTSAYIVGRGRLAVRAAGHDHDHDLSTLAPGSAVGQLALLLDRPRSATVVALDDVQLWEVPREAFEEALERSEVWSTQFLLAAARELAGHLAAVSERLVGLLDDSGPVPLLPEPRTAELAELRERLFREWSF